VTGPAGDPASGPSSERRDPPEGDGPPARSRRAVVLVGGPVAPYSRALRVARVLDAEGYETEIAAVAAAGLPAEEALGPVYLRRYRPSGPWARLGASRAATTVPGAVTGPAGKAGVANGGAVMVGERTAREAASGEEAGGRPGESAAGERTAGERTAGERPGPPRRRRLLDPVLALRRWLFWPHTARGWWATLARDLPPADVYHACGVLAVPAALAARDRTPIGPGGATSRVIYDAIDDALGGNEARRMPRAVRAWHVRRERAWARRSDARVTVNEVLADRLAARWRTDRPLVLLNVPEPPDPAVIARPPDLLRSATGLAPSTRIVLFQGRLGPDLGLEAAAEAVLRVPDTALVLLGFGRGFTAARARDADPRYAGRHVTLGAQPPDALLAWTASADVALIPLPPVSPNQRAATPNKFWEAIAVGTPVVVTADLGVIRDLVERYDLGAVAASEHPEDLAAAIASALDRVSREGDAWRTRIAATAAERFGWPQQAAAYRDLVRATVSAGAPARRRT
jgi:glycosyltransferase involved in cell wall biosynthesis